MTNVSKHQYQTKHFPSYEAYAKWAKMARNWLALAHEYETAIWTYGDGTQSKPMVRRPDTKSQTGCDILKWSLSSGHNRQTSRQGT
jgi:hypothetical protein